MNSGMGVGLSSPSSYLNDDGNYKNESNFNKSNGFEGAFAN